MNAHYLNQRVIHGQKYSNVKAFRYMNNEEGQHCIMTVGNCIELFKVFIDGLSLQRRFEFQGNLVKIEVIMSKNHASDYVWILDSRGRFGCWTPEKGLQVVNNEITCDTYCEGQESSALSTVLLDIMSGVTFDFEENDTVGALFYTIQRKIVVLQFVINKQGIIIGKISEEKVPSDMSIRYIDWIRQGTSESSLGFIMEKQSSTVLEVYRFVHGEKILNSKKLWELQKKNLLHFRSQISGDILITTFDEISLHGFKHSHPYKCYRTKGHYGQGFSLGDGFYGHFGKELAVFSKDRLRIFNDFKFPEEDLTEERAFIESSRIGCFECGTIMISLVSHRWEVFLFKISENQCQVIKYNKGIVSLSNFKTFQSFSDKFVVVGSSTEKTNEVILVERAVSTKICKEQELPFVIDSLIATIGGDYLLVSSREANFVLRLTRNTDYQLYFYLPQGQIITASGNFLVLDHGVFEIDYQAQNCQPVFKESIVLSRIIEEQIYLLTSKGAITVWNSLNDKVRIVAEECKTDYCWGNTISTSALMCANIESPFSLRLISEENVEKVPIRGHIMVSSLSSVTYKDRKELIKMGGNLNQQLLIGYADGSIHLQTQNGDILSSFSLFSSIFAIFERTKPNQVIILSGDRQYILNYSKQGCKLKDIQISPSKSHIQNVVFLQKLNRILFIQDRMGRQILKEANVQQKNDIARYTTVKISEKSPLILTREESILIVSCKIIEQYDIRTKRIKKQGNHCLDQVNSIDQIPKGVIMVGISREDAETILIMNECLETVHTFHIDIKRPLKAVKSIKNTNDFFLWSQMQVTLNRIEPSGQLRVLFGSQLALQTHTVDLCEDYKMFMVNDPYRYCSLYVYENSITQMANYLPTFQALHTSFIGQNILVSDQRGKMQILGIDRDQILFHRSIFVKKASLQLGSVISAYDAKNGEILFITSDLSIFRIQPVERDQFDLLLRLQEESLKLQVSGPSFSYWPWREKTVWDKIIDGDFLLMKTADRSFPSSEFGSQKWNFVMNLLKM